jgi:hypothetical protein
MYGIEEINRMNDVETGKAKHYGKRPMVAKKDGENLIGIPSLGDYRPRGWKLVKTLFVDSSGFGAPDEPALTIDQFYSKVKAGFGYAVIEAGQFQVYVGVFERKVVRPTCSITCDKYPSTTEVKCDKCRDKKICMLEH